MTARIIKALQPAESQRVFRTVLEALARPGTVQTLPPGPLDTLAAAAVPAFALADSSTGVCVLEPPDSPLGLSATLRTATSAPVWPIELASLVTAVRPLTSGELRSFSRGTPHAPEDAALVSLSVHDVHGGKRPWQLSGPGVDTTTTLAPHGLPDDFVSSRAEVVSGYPSGIDILLVTDDGRVVGLPRTTTIIEED